jgi:hypothetical protein
MRYLLLHYLDESTMAGPDPAGSVVEDQLSAWVAEVEASGTKLYGGELRAVRDSRVIRVRHGELMVTDGPFAETKEVIGGYAVLAGDNREDVIRSTKEFMQLHLDHWPGWEGECELRELVFLAP